MSQYYVPSRQQSHRRASTSPSTSSGDHFQRSREGLLLIDDDLNESRYIFPNPSSSNDLAAVSTPSQSYSSVFSTPTDSELYYSTTSTGVAIPPSLRDERSNESLVDLDMSVDAGRLYASFGSAGDTDGSWDWYGDAAPVEDGFSEFSSGAELDSVGSGRWNVVDRASGPAVATAALTRPRRQHPLMPRARRFSDYVRSRTHSRSTTASISTSSFRSSIDDRNPSTPHPRVRIPLLSLIASLFAVDETTLHLLTHSTTHRGSVLFPGHMLAEPLSLSEPSSDDEDEASEVRKDKDDVHGFHKLLLSSDLSSESWKSLKKGLAIVYTSTVPVPSMGIVKLWGLVNRVWVKGGQTMKKAY